jgi:hypothetical protein
VSVVEVGTERHAIHLEMTYRSPDEIAGLFDDASPAYDAVVCFSTPKGTAAH